jgi:hypothetical protein
VAGGGEGVRQAAGEGAAGGGRGRVAGWEEGPQRVVVGRGGSGSIWWEVGDDGFGLRFF